MRFSVFLIGLLLFGFSVSISARDGDEVMFRLNSIQLLKNTWGGGDANVKILIIYANGSGEESELKVVANKKASVRKTISLRQNASIGIPIYDKNDIDVEVIILNENENTFLASLVIKAIRNIAKRKGVKRISRLSKRTWHTLVAEQVFSFGVDYGANKIIAYLKRNEILKTRFTISNEDREATEMRGNVEIAYRTRLVSRSTFPGGHDVDHDLAFEPEMQFIRGGRFQMGSPASEKDRDDDEKQHRVTVGDFWMAKTETTFKQWQACVDDGGCQSNKKPKDYGWGRGNRPVVGVSWHDANEYAQWLSQKTGKNYRLPTEAEWEYAARGGTSTAFSFGNRITTAQANFDGNYTYNGSSKGRYLKKTAPVGSYPANRYQLNDMHGNVYEWTCSAYNKNYNGSESQCVNKNDSRSRVLRGGSWVELPRYVRSANRNNINASYRNNSVGFRLSRTR